MYDHRIADLHSFLGMHVLCFDMSAQRLLQHYNLHRQNLIFVVCLANVLSKDQQASSHDGTVRRQVTRLLCW